MLCPKHRVLLVSGRGFQDEPALKCPIPGCTHKVTVTKVKPRNGKDRMYKKHGKGFITAFNREFGL